MKVSAWFPIRLVALGVAAMVLAVPASGPVLAASGAAPAPVAQAQQRPPVPPGEIPEPQTEPNPSPLTPKQERERLKSNFEKMKQDADELAALAKSLQQDLDKSNQNVLSLKVVDKAERIEKLARKIKSAALE